MRVFAATLVAEDPEILSRVDMERALDGLEEASSRLPLPVFLAFKSGVFLFEYSVFPFAMKVRPFRWLPLAARLRCLGRWEYGRLALTRNLYKLMKILAITHMLRDEALVEHLGHGPHMRHRLGQSTLPEDQQACTVPGSAS
jgi:hypothetical protein